MTAPAGESPDHTKRNLVISGAIGAAIGAGIALLAIHGGGTRGETPIIISDRGSIYLESKDVDWKEYQYFPDVEGKPEAHLLMSKDSNGRIRKIEDTENHIVDCSDADDCVIVIRYENKDKIPATVLLRSGKKALFFGKGLTLMTTIPYGQYDESNARVLQSKDESFKVISAAVWTGAKEPTKLCLKTGSQCDIRFEYK